MTNNMPTHLKQPVILTILLLVLALTPPAFGQFVAETIDAQVAIGYGIALEDVDGDGKKDILLADQREFVWYRNPDWKRYVIVQNLTEQDNVCLAARDIDGDGKVEIAVGAEWNPGDTVDSGSVHYLVPPADRTQPWRPVKLHHEPVVHRMRWIRNGDNRYVLVVAPLHGRDNRGGEGNGVRFLAYQPPADRDQAAGTEWSTEVLDDSLHVTHNFDRGGWFEGAKSETGMAEQMVYLGREGALLIHHDGERWRKARMVGVEGGGEIRMGRLVAHQFLATVEPFHGDKLVVYRYPMATAETPSPALADRKLLDDNFNAGHAIATGDFLGLGADQIVAGWRSPNRDGKVGVRLYSTNDDGVTWESRWIDENGMACEDVRVADLDGDGRLDIVAAGRATHNLKVYWNRPTSN